MNDMNLIGSSNIQKVSEFLYSLPKCMVHVTIMLRVGTTIIEVRGDKLAK